LFREAHALGLVDAAGRHESYTDISDLISTVEPVPVTELINYVPEDLDMLLRQWLRIDPQMRCPGTPETMAQRTWHQLTAVLELVRAGQEAGFLAGPRVAHQPNFAELRAQWHSRQPGHARPWTGNPRSGSTVEEPHPDTITVPGARDAETMEPDAPRGPAQPASGEPGRGTGASTQPAPEGYAGDEEDR
jgi:hypothetical protein